MGIQKHKKCIYLWTLACLLSSPAIAQSEITLAGMQIDFWPEYDRKSMLIIYSGTLASDVVLPASLSIAIPAENGPPLAVAHLSNPGQLVNTPYQTETVGDSIVTTFTVPSKYFQFEYYDGSLEFRDTIRSYQFKTSFPFRLESLSFFVRQPRGASELTMSPSLAKQQPDPSGVTFYAASLPSVATGEDVQFNLSYRKDSDVLSVAGPQGQAQAQVQAQSTEMPFTAARSSRIESGSLAVIIIAAVAVLAIIIGGGMYKSARAKRPSKGDGAYASTGADQGAAAFCRKCGSSVSEEDNFCSRCGAKIS